MNQTYVVKQGDTLYGISNQFGVSVTELANLNNVNASTLQIGQVLTIPSASGTNPNNMFIYTVKKGDSLYSIAQKYNTTANAIVKLNNLKSTSLSIGQTLRIPEMYTPEDAMVLPNYINYVVKIGDTLYSVARDNNVSVDTIMKDNALTSNNLTVGQNLKIRVPSSNGTIQIEECLGPDYTPPVITSPVTTTYTVNSGDNLYSIANRFNTTVSAIMNLNNLPNANLSIGQQLKIPTTSSSGTGTGIPTSQNYIVKSGDNLYSIARRFNTTASAIMSLNNLPSNNLSIGQQLKIPTASGSGTSSSTPTSQTYTVKSGDSLYSIARRFNTTVDTIKRKNNLTSNALSIGQKLII